MSFANSGTLREEQPMRKNSFGSWQILVAVLAVPGFALAQTGQQNSTLTVSGQSGQATLVQMNGKSYVDLESLARLVNGSLGFNGRQVILTIPGSPATSQATVSPPSQPTNTGFSKDFVRAGIEEMSAIREWRSVIVNVIQNSYPFSESSWAVYSAEAAKGLKLASVAMSTDSDRSAFQLLSNEFNNMQMLSNHVLEKKNAMEYMPPGYLDGNSLNQKVLGCAHSLAAMAASGQFVDDGSCD
jgi:hypothetical protein